MLNRYIEMIIQKKKKDLVKWNHTCNSNRYGLTREHNKNSINSFSLSFSLLSWLVLCREFFVFFYNQSNVMNKPCIKSLSGLSIFMNVDNGKITVKKKIYSFFLPMFQQNLIQNFCRGKKPVKKNSLVIFINNNDDDVHYLIVLIYLTFFFLLIPV